jgi:hypothetical protein
MSRFLPFVLHKRKHTTMSSSSPSSSSPQQVAALLQALIAKGIEAKDALPIIKTLVQAKILNLEQVTDSNLPKSIPSKIRNKLLKKKRTATSDNTNGPNKKRRKVNRITVPLAGEEPPSILINRSPVLTLWASIVAKKLYSLPLEQALTFGSAYEGLTAKGKGTSLGIYQKTEEENNSHDRTFELMGQTIPARTATSEGRVALSSDGQEQDPHRTWKHLEKKFGSHLGFVLQEMERAAENAGHSLSSTAYSYYMHIRPDIPHGTKGWGAHGHLQTANLSNYYDTKRNTRKDEQSAKESSS